MTLRPSRRAVLSAAAVLLTGCSEVPSQGPVKRADGPRAAARESIDVAPHPPADGASIDLVVGGFLQAMASVRDDYRVARSYLTSDIADRWDPHAKVTIYDATNHKPASTVATAALQAPWWGRSIPEATIIRLVLKLSIMTSEWRRNRVSGVSPGLQKGCSFPSTPFNGAGRRFPSTF
ncbi:hypothetical protein TPCU411_12790 [Cutibacterium acnes]|nr:hypothetical protein TPCU411_12790 [Cutibacterium acnes]